MRITVRDWIATVMVAAIAVPYVGYLVRGDMPYLEDSRGMSAIALILGAVAYVAVTWGETVKETSRTVNGLAIAALVLGVAAVALAETFVAEALLALFMVSIMAAWLASMADHLGWMPRHLPTSPAR